MENKVEKIILDSLKELLELKWIEEPNEEKKNKLVYPTKYNNER